MNIKKNIEVHHKVNNIRVDVFHKNNHNTKLVLFLHGFKGFKDWGAWDLVAQKFAGAGFIFVKFNFSYNGIGQEKFTEFTRLDLFRKNNYTKELEDTKTVLDWIDKHPFWDSFSVEETFIIGHSRGGGIALCTAFEQSNISKVVTWASISDFNRFGSSENIEEWKNKGFKNFYNGRTKQNMEIDIQFYENYIKNKQRLNIEHAVKHLKKPQLIIHGTADDSVGFSHAQRLKKWNTNAQLKLIEKANHVFGSMHPYDKKQLPEDLKNVVNTTITFFNV